MGTIAFNPVFPVWGGHGASPVNSVHPAAPLSFPRAPFSSLRRPVSQWPWNAGLRGLGAADPTIAKIAGGTATIVGAGAGLTASGVFGASAAALAAGPIGAAIVAAAVIAALLANWIGGGCGTACINASMAEQIYEAAADNAYLVGKLGMVSASEAVALMQTLIQMGQQHEAQWSTDAAKNGAANLAKVINAEIAVAESLPTSPSIPVDLSAARSVYVGGTGWYPQSSAAAAQLTDQWLTSLAAQPGRISQPVSATVTADASTIVNAATAAETNVATALHVAPNTVLIGAALLALLLVTGVL